MPKVDPKLFHQAQEGNRRAFRKLIWPFRGLIYSVAYGMHENHPLARKHLREIQRTAYRSLSNLKNETHLPRWLYSLTHRHVQEHLRLAPRSASGRPAQGSNSESYESMARAWSNLAQPHRVVLGMKYTNDYSPRELADILGISDTEAKARLFEARKRMRWNVLRYLYQRKAPRGGAQEKKRTNWSELGKRWVGPPTREEESVVKRLFSLYPRMGFQHRGMGFQPMFPVM